MRCSNKYEAIEYIKLWKNKTKKKRTFNLSLVFENLLLGKISKKFKQFFNYVIIKGFKRL